MKKKTGIGAKTTKRTLRVKTEKQLGEIEEPKKKAKKVKIEPVIRNAGINLDKIFDLIDDQIDDLSDGKRIQIGKLFMQLKKGIFTVHETINGSKKLFIVKADSDGIGYNQTLVYLMENAL